MVIALVTIIGALIPTFILSRLLLWSLKRWQAPHWRLIVAHGLSLSIAIVIAGLGNADGGSFAGERSVAIYAPAQAFWLIVDFIRHFRSSRMRTDHLGEHVSLPLSKPVGRASSMGILVTALGLLLLVFGLMTGGWGYSGSSLSEVSATLGLLMTLFGYAVTRLWFWATK